MHREVTGGARARGLRPPIPSRACSVRRAVAGSVGTSVLIQALNLLTGVLLARSLGVEDRGVLAAVILWPGVVATVGSLSIGDALTYRASHATVALGPLTGTALVLGVLQSAALVASGAAVVVLALGGYGSEAVRLGFLYLGYVPLFLLTVYAMSILQGLHRFRAFQAIRIALIAAVACVLVALAAVSSLTVQTAVIGYVGAYGACAVLALGLLARERPGPLSFDRRLARELGGYGLKAHSGTVSTMLGQRLDQIAIALVLGPAKLGLYVVALAAGSLTALVGYSISLVTLPAVARAETAEARRAATARFVSATLYASALVSVPLLVLIPVLIDVFFGAAFAAAATAARILLLSALLAGTARVLASGLKAAGRPLEAGLGDVVALAVVAGALVLLLPPFGISGAAAATAAGAAFGFAWLLRASTRAFGLRTRDLLISPASLLAPAVAPVAAPDGRPESA